MRCLRCEVEKPKEKFRIKRYSNRSGVRLTRSGICNDCHKAMVSDYDRRRPPRKRSMQPTPLPCRPDKDMWYALRKPWPWPPGTKVFEDVQLQRKVK